MTSSESLEPSGVPELGLTSELANYTDCPKAFGNLVSFLQHVHFFQSTDATFRILSGYSTLLPTRLGWKLSSHTPKYRTLVFSSFGYIFSQFYFMMEVFLTNLAAIFGELSSWKVVVKLSSQQGVGFLLHFPGKTVSNYTLDFFLPPLTLLFLFSFFLCCLFL